MVPQTVLALRGSYGVAKDSPIDSFPERSRHAVALVHHVYAEMVASRCATLRPNGRSRAQVSFFTMGSEPPRLRSPR